MCHGWNIRKTLVVESNSLKIDSTLWPIVQCGVDSLKEPFFFFRPKRGHQKKKETRNNNERSQEKRPWYIASVTYTHFIIIGQGFRRLFFFFAGFFFFSFLLAGQTNGRKPQHISHFILSPEIGSEIGVFCLSFLFFTIRNHLTRHATIEEREREKKTATRAPHRATRSLV